MSNSDEPKHGRFQERLPPQNLEAEMCVIGSVLLMHEAIDEVSDLLRAEHFYADRNQKIFAAILGLHESGVRGIDAVTLAEELDRRKQFKEIGEVEYLSKIMESVPNAAHAKYYAKIVRDRWLQRSMVYACTEVLNECYTGTRETEDILQSAEQRIFGIVEQHQVEATMSITDMLADVFSRIDLRRQNGGKISGVASGFSDIDKQMNGFHAAELIILAARPAMGKTAIICNIADSVAKEARDSGTRKGCLIFSLEMSHTELAERLLCIRSRVNGHRLRAGTVDDREYDDMMRASADMHGLPLFIDDLPYRTMSQISAVCRRMHRRHGLGIVIIDYLQLIEPEDHRAPREQQVAQITRRLKYLSKELGIPVIALAQLNRGVENRENKQPRLADLRESGAIEQDADVVMFLHRPAAYDPNDRPGEADVIIAKNRNGPIGTVTLSWLSETMRFEDMANRRHRDYDRAAKAFPPPRQLPLEPDDEDRPWDVPHARDR